MRPATVKLIFGDANLRGDAADSMELTSALSAPKVTYMGEITAEAPNFSGDYPGEGQRIGPAWRAAWDALRDGAEHPAEDLVTIMRGAADIQDRTARNLLRQARAAGVLRVRYETRRPGERYRRPIYRVAAS